MPLAIPDPPLVSPGTLGVWVAADRLRVDYDRRNQLLLMEGRRPDALFIGDSHTEGWAVSEQFSDLFPLCVNRGIGGDAAMHLGLRLEADAFQLKPRNLFFLIGANDMSFRFGYDADEKILADLERHHRAMFPAMRACGAKVYVGAIPPLRPTQIDQRHYQRLRVLIPAWNRRLRELVAEHGFSSIDYHTPLLESEGLLRADCTYDGGHLTARGYWLLGRAVRKVLAQDPPAR
jgi:lysophospholipase L1-like esterase